MLYYTILYYTILHWPHRHVNGRSRLIGMEGAAHLVCAVGVPVAAKPPMLAVRLIRDDAHVLVLLPGEHEAATNSAHTCVRASQACGRVSTRLWAVIPVDRLQDATCAIQETGATCSFSRVERHVSPTRRSEGAHGVAAVNMDTTTPNGGPRTPGWMAGAAGGAEFVSDAHLNCQGDKALLPNECKLKLFSA